MKKIKTRFLLTLLLCIIGVSASAYDFEVDGLCYNYNEGVNGSSVSITYKSLTPNTYSGSVIIPSKVTFDNHTYNVTGIGEYTFASCYLTQVAIPPTVTSIGHHAFSSCSELYSITIPNSVTSIEWATFVDCTSLNTITIPNSIKSIGESAFARCSALYSIIIGNSVTSIEGWAFENCSSLNSITIPNSVTTIGNSAFQGCTGLWSVTIGNSVKSIGNNAFEGCLDLSSVYITDIAAWCNIEFKDMLSNPLSYKKDSQTWISGKPVYKSPQLYVNGQAINSLVIPNTVTSIKDYAFVSCNYLVSVDISSSVKSIGNYAFQDCCCLSSVTIPDYVTSIGNGAFSSCWNLTSFTLPNTVENIGNSAFSGCKKLVAVNIPNSVTSIGRGAFSGCEALTSITIPSSVISIGSCPLAGCYSLTTIMVDIGNPTYNSDNNNNVIIHTETRKLIAGCRNSKITNAVSSIGERAFQSVKGLTSIIIPNSVTEIEDYAFAWCSDLASISFSSSLNSIGRYAFDGTLWYKNQSDGLIYAGNVVLGYKNTLPYNVILKEGTLGIAAWAFEGCNTLQSITMPNSLTTIGEYAFLNCRGLLSINISNSVTSIEDYAFWGCSGISSVDIPNSVKYLGKGAFRECTALSTVSIGNSITSIEGWTFSGCPYLTSIVIPNSVISIGEAAFSGCTYLESITIPSSVTSINSSTFWGTFDGTSWYNNQHDGLVYAGKVIYKYKGAMANETDLVIEDGTLGIAGSAFYGKSGLTSVTIPKSVVFIGNYAFEECRNLTAVTVKNPIPISIDSGTFTNRSNATLFVPKGCKAVYETADYWKDYKKIVELDDNSVVDPTGLHNTLYCTETEALVGSKEVMSVELKNEDEVKLCQFDLRLPDGVTVATKNNGKLDAKLTGRAENHIISSQRLSNGDYRFVVSSLDNESIAGNSGVLMEITLEVVATMETGEYTVKVQNAELSVPDGNDLKVVRPTDTESKLKVKAYTPGDVNNDGSVSVTDVGCAINYILEQVPSVFVFDAADMNGDRSVSVTDVGMIINLILNEGVSGSRGMAEEKVNNDNHFSPNLSLQATAVGYELQLEDKDALIGFQFDVELGDGATINGVQLNEAADSDHLLTYRRLNNGKWRVVCYSPTNSTFTADDTALLTISVVGNASERYFTGNAGTATLGSVAHFSDIRLTTAGLDELRPAALVSMPTGIANVKQDMKMSVQGKTLCITSDRDITLRLLTIGGNVYRILHVHRGQNNFDDLRAGIYMIDNKKIIIR